MLTKTEIQAANDLERAIVLTEARDAQFEIARLTAELAGANSQNAMLMAKVRAFYLGNPEGGIVAKLETELAASQERERVLREAVEYAIEHGDFFNAQLEHLMKALGEP